MTVLQNAPPHCFGKLWDPKSAECAGGIDPAYKNEETGSNIRQQCVYFNTCGTKLQASRMEPARNLLDPRSLVRHTPPVLGPKPPPQQNQVAEFVNKFAQALHQQQIVPKPPPNMVVHQQAPAQPMMVPQGQVVVPMQYGYQPMMPVNYQMPGYLTVPETRYPEQSFLGFAFRMVLRSMGKSAGHSIAHLFDTVPLAGGPSGSGGSSNGG